MLLILDGLDEASSLQKKQDIQDSIGFLNSDFKDSKAGIIVTSRLSGFSFARSDFVNSQDAWVQGSFQEFRIARILPLTFEMQVRTAVKRGIDRNLFEREIMSNPNYLELAGTPLFCSMMIELLKETRQLPEMRSKLYNDAIENLIKIQFKKYRADMEQLFKLPENLARVIDFLSCLANLVHAERKRDFREYFVIEKFPGPDNLWPNLKQIIDDDKFSVIVPVNKKEGNYRFSHLSFQEFLTSNSWCKQFREELEKKAKKKNRGVVSRLEFIESVKDKVFDIWYLEPFSLLAGNLSSEEFDILGQQLITASRVGLVDSVIVKMMEERKSKQKEPMVYRHLEESMEKRLRRKIITQGLVYPCKEMREIATKCIFFFQVDREYVVQFLKSSFKENHPGKYIGEALRACFFQQQQQQLQQLQQLQPPSPNNLANSAAGQSILNFDDSLRRKTLTEFSSIFKALSTTERLKRLSVLEIIERIVDRNYPCPEQEQIFKELSEALKNEVFF